jgi:hypothetical protein
MLTPLLPLLLLFSYGPNHSVARRSQKSPERDTGTLEKMIVANGSAAMDLDLNRLNGLESGSRMTTLRFALVPDSFFTVLVFNNDLRGPLPSSIGLTPQNVAALPATLNASYQQLVIESMPWGEPFELVVRDGKSGFVFFNIEGQAFDYEANDHFLSTQTGRLLLSKEFATALGRPSDAGSAVGKFSLGATMRTIEITRFVNGEVTSDVLPARSSGRQGNQPDVGSVPGPDVIVGDLTGLAQFDGSSGTQVGLAVATDSCNAGTIDLHWFALPNNDHPVIPQNLYRMSGGLTNDERFEQIGQSNVKHAFTALTNNICGFGCNGVGGSNLGSGCSDPYSASLNSGGSGHSLGSRAWINPFSGAYPRGDSATPPNSHTGHTHTGPSHRILVEINDLNTTLNLGATYWVEAQYITPHEYTWCQANPGQCNMYNNVSHRKYTVVGTGSPFSFSTGGSVTVREKAAIAEWTGAASVEIKPDTVNDGIGLVAYKVTNPSPGVWHYEYAIYNQNLDRGIQSFSVPVGNGVTLTNIGFHAPPQQPGWAADGTVGNAGYSSAPWTVTQGGGAITWSSETFAQNQNANAIRWGTLYNFRFDANSPPTSAQTNSNTSPTVNATVGFFKTGSPITVQVQGPSSPTAANGIITGRIADQNGAPVSGVVVSLSGSQNRKIITDSNGNYRFDAVETSGFYTVTPSLTNYRFTPATRSFSQLGNNTNALFTATRDAVVSGNAIDTPEYFVRQHYLDFLGREPDGAGFNFWSDQVLSCGSDAACIERRTINVSAAYFLSIEFQQTGGVVDGLYRASYGRRPQYAEFGSDTAVVGQNVVVGIGDWAGQLATNTQSFINAWIQRPAFRAAYDGLGNSDYVDTLISHARGFNGDRNALIDGLNSDSLSRASALRSIVENEGFVTGKRNESFVMMQYFGYLRRDPDESGFQFWLNKLNQFGGSFEQAEMVKAFLASSEYRNRFRQ